jgi:Domain of unknown function (DUF4389)
VSDHEPHPIRLVVRDDLRRSRLTVLLRLVLAIPQFVWFWWFSTAAFFVAIVNWFATLITGQPQAGMHDFLARFTRYYLHLNAYLYLVANPFPGFLGEPGRYPLDLEVDGPTRQNRWVTAFRIPLAAPAVVFAYVLGLVVFYVGLVGWFVALAIGRMPKGMRDLMAYCLRYQAQTLGYVVLLTSRYPTTAAVSELRAAAPSPQP